MKVVLIAENDAPLRLMDGLPVARGGAEKQIATVATRLASAGHDVVLLHGGPADAPVDEPAASRRIGRGTVTAHLVSLSWRPRSVLAFVTVLRSLRADLVYARLPHDFLLFACLYARSVRRTRFVYAIADDAVCNPWQAVEHRRWFHGSLFALVLRLAHAVLVQHEGQRALLAGRRRGEIRLLANVVDPIAESARPWDRIEHDAVWVAHFRPMKRLDRFLDLAEALPQLRFALIGDFVDEGADQRATLQPRIDALPNVRWLGRLAAGQTREVVARSGVLLNTSEHEGFPNTFLEAWSVGVPVVSLSVDPGDVVASHGLGRISGTVARMVEDVRELATDQRRNAIVGRAGLAYVRSTHAADVVDAELDRLVHDRPSTAVRPTAELSTGSTGAAA